MIENKTETMSKNRAIKKLQLERQLRYAVETTKAHLKDDPEVDTESALRASLSRAMERNAFLERNNTEPWYTGCYNQLEGFTGYGTDKSKSLSSDLVKKDNGWNKPIDLSFKNPWPEARWDWFEDRVSGDQVYGTGGGTMELGNRRGGNLLLEGIRDGNKTIKHNINVYEIIKKDNSNHSDTKDSLGIYELKFSKSNSILKKEKDTVFLLQY
jgi:hypothetical protein